MTLNMEMYRHLNLNLYVIDIETTAIIDGQPLSAVKPVGIAVIYPNGTSAYLAFGHPEGNSCTEAEAAEFIWSIWGEEWLGHNILAFDIPVLQAYFGLPDRDPLLTHDTLLMAFLHNPNFKSVALKTLCKELLFRPPLEQAALNDWILANTECRSVSKAGAYISQAPGDLVGDYALADVQMTAMLFDYLQPKVMADLELPDGSAKTTSLRPAYDRERHLVPVLSGMREVGVRVDWPRLHLMLHICQRKVDELTGMIREQLLLLDLELSKPNQLVSALKAQGFVRFLLTPTGKPSTKGVSLDHALGCDHHLLDLLHNRSLYEKLLTFLRSWQDLAVPDANGDYWLHPAYNAVKGPDGGGTRTGRLSCAKPNVQQVPKASKDVDYFGEDYPDLRSLLLPDPGHIWLSADFKSQEPRIAAHFEEGMMSRAFQDQPSLDLYTWVVDLCGWPTEPAWRKVAKTIFLGILYGAGAKVLAAQIEKAGYTCTEALAQTWRAQIKAALPDIVALNRDAQNRFENGWPILTLGGRQVYCEPPVDGRSFTYKALNTLIQSSAADQSKAELVWLAARLPEYGARIIGTIHDEVAVSCPPDHYNSVKTLLEQSTGVFTSDVPFLLDIQQGANWGEAKG